VKRIGQHVNFDFLLENRSDAKLKLSTVEPSVFDRAGALARRDFGRTSVAMQGENGNPWRRAISCSQNGDRERGVIWPTALS
jgi:hypothetical protein